MEVFSRRENERLLIGDDVVVTVLQVERQYVRLSIECPRLTPAYREEILYKSDDQKSTESELSEYEVLRCSRFSVERI